jgi:hypothetical protein
MFKQFNTAFIFLPLGNVVNGTIGKQMVDTLVESASNVEVSVFKQFYPSLCPVKEQNISETGAVCIFRQNGGKKLSCISWKEHISIIGECKQSTTSI